MTNKLLDNFRRKVAFKTSLSDAFRRGHVYNTDFTESQKNKAKARLIPILKEKLPSIIECLDIENGYTEENLCNQIEKLANDITKLLPNDLNNSRFRIGTAQKLINVYWKFLWLFELTEKEPLHCPIDSIILGTLDEPFKSLRWTQLDSIGQYKEIIEEIRIKAEAKDQSIAVWELEVYDQKVN
ncbi:hypothetical protein GC194_00480 [bacterium]|nr:hypothetical protein [bacterium]